MRPYLEGSVRDWEVLADIIPVPRQLGLTATLPITLRRATLTG